MKGERGDFDITESIILTCFLIKGPVLAVAWQ